MEMKVMTMKMPAIRATLLDGGPRVDQVMRGAPAPAVGFGTSFVSDRQDDQACCFRSRSESAAPVRFRREG
jgi:hypothetical protein